jgi:antirestriction factor ArdC-like protein
MPAEQSKPDWNALMEEALNAPGNLTGVYDRFWNYSLTNMLLFRMQGVREPVASFKRWKSLGRHVLRGARAKEVIVPLLVNEKPDDETLEEKRERVARLIGFKVVRGVFALSDTDGPEIPPKPIPKWDVDRAMQKLGISRVPFQELNGNIQGVSRGVELAINPLAVHPEKTLAHEMGHIILGHTLPHSISEYATHRGLKEFEAEGTAYLVLNELELLDAETASHSRGYIQEWLKGEEKPGEREIRLVFAATETILKAGRPNFAPNTDRLSRTSPDVDVQEAQELPPLTNGAE